MGDHRRHIVPNPVRRHGLGSASGVLYFYTSFMVVVPSLVGRTDPVGVVVEDQQEEKRKLVTSSFSSFRGAS